jgi:hypothetical protein
MNKYFIHNGKEKIGPFDIDQLSGMEQEIIEMSKTANLYVWNKDMEDWTDIKKIEEFKEVLPTLFVDEVEPPPFEIKNEKKIDLTPPPFKEDIIEAVEEETNISTERPMKKVLSLKEKERLDLEWSYKKNRYIDIGAGIGGIIMALFIGKFLMQIERETNFKLVKFLLDADFLGGIVWVVLSLLAYSLLKKQTDKLKDEIEIEKEG